MSYKGGKKSNLYDSVEGYNLFADQYSHNHNYLNTFEDDGFFILMGDACGKKVLDAGCGTGRAIDRIKIAGARDITGIDVSDKMIEIAQKHHSTAKFVVGDCEEMPFEDESFDVVVAMFLIVHLKKLDKFFDEVYRVLKPGGVFIVSNVNQKKAPKLKLKNGEEIVIDSHYHIPRHVTEALENSFFKIEFDHYVYDDKIWTNQITKAVK